MASDPHNELSDEQLADLARLADGTLPPELRAEVEARVAASPELTRALQMQAVAIDALQQANRDTGAPARLRAQLERGQSGRKRTQPEGGQSRRRSAPRRRTWRGAVAAAMAAVLALALVLPGILSQGLSVAEAATFAEKPPTQSAPAGVPGTPQLLQVKVAGVPFPDYAKKFGWTATGRRDDHRSGRHATTVFYRENGRSMAYTIVSGNPLDPPSHAQLTTLAGVDYRVFRHNGRTVVTWKRGGHTCVLSAKGVPVTELVALAAWRGKGVIPF
jgi:anti-sigma factor RsiW